MNYKTPLVLVLNGSKHSKKHVIELPKVIDNEHLEWLCNRLCYKQYKHVEIYSKNTKIRHFYDS
jgi:hypothetical protein